MGNLFVDNIKDSFLELGQFIATTKDPDVIERLDRPSYNQVYADLTTSFTILIGIFFPSVTGKLIKLCKLHLGFKLISKLISRRQISKKFRQKLVIKIFNFLAYC